MIIQTKFSIGDRVMFFRGRDDVVGTITGISVEKPDDKILVNYHITSDKGVLYTEGERWIKRLL